MKKYLFVLFVLSGVLGSAQEVVLSNFRIENEHKNRVYFESSDAIIDASVLGFYISGKSIADIHINGSSASGHYISCSSEFTFWDNNTIRYEGSDSNIVKFALTYIRNNISEPEANKYYYVATSGSDSNDGLSENSAFRTINKAASVANAGSTVWVKAGNYGKEYVSISHSGTPTQPIKFVGYRENIGDITSMYYNYGDGALNSSKMPLIDHGSPTSKTYAIKASYKDYIVIRNFQFSNCNQAIYNEYGNANIIDNCVAKEVGSESAAYGRSFYHNGEGINNRILNSTSINSSRSSFTTNSDFTLFYNNRAYCNEPGTNESTDYYFQLGNKASHCIIIDNYAKRDGELYHSGHGLSIENAENTSRITEFNLVENFTSVNMRGVELRHSGVRYNVVRGMIIYGEGSGSNKSTGIVIRDGAHDNIVENCVIDTGGRNSGIFFWDSAEDEASFGFDNIIRNNVFKNCGIGIYINDSEGNSGKGSGNKIYNNTFYNISSMFRTKGSPNFYGNEIKNNILHSVAKFEYSGGDGNGWVLDFNNFHNGIYGKGNNTFRENPEFEDESNQNFRLKSISAIRNKGVILKEMEMDFDCNPRPSAIRPDIGAFQYQDDAALIGRVEANAGDDVELCLGEEVTLTATGGKTYTWSTGGNSSSITVSPSETTTYVVTVSDGLTEDSDEVTVTVNRVIASAGPNVDIKKGESVSLTASGGDSFEWNTGETTRSITVTPDKTTKYSVSVRKGSCSAIDEVIVSVADDQTEKVIANAGVDRVICLGESVQLTASGGSSYAWSTGDLSSTITVSPTETTTYTVDVSEGSVSDTDKVTVTVLNVAAFAGEDVSIIEGESVTLTASGGDTYVWNTGETSKTIEVNPGESTEYSVIAYKGSCYDSSKVLVTVISEQEELQTEIFASAGEDISICSGESAILTGSGGEKYLWDTGETSKSITVSPDRTKTYKLEVIVGDISKEASVTVTVENCANLADSRTIETPEMIVYPNPSEGEFKIEIENVPENSNLVINDVKGSVLYMDKVKANNSTFSKVLNFSALSDGIYYVRLYNAYDSVVKKLVIL